MHHFVIRGVACPSVLICRKMQWNRNLRPCLHMTCTSRSNTSTRSSLSPSVSNSSPNSRPSAILPKLQAGLVWILCCSFLQTRLSMARHSDNDLTRSGEQQESITIVFLALAWTFVFLRTWTRMWIISSFGWDDLTMILATVYLFLNIPENRN